MNSTVYVLFPLFNQLMRKHFWYIIFRDFHTNQSTLHCATYTAVLPMYPIPSVWSNWHLWRTCSALKGWKKWWNATWDVAIATTSTLLLAPDAWPESWKHYPWPQLMVWTTCTDSASDGLQSISKGPGLAGLSPLCPESYVTGAIEDGLLRLDPRLFWRLHWLVIR